MKKCFTLFFILFFTLKAVIGDSQHLYPIPTIVLETNKTKKVDLSVYKRDRDIQLKIGDHPDLEIKFLPEVDSLYIFPKETARGLLLLSLDVNDYEYKLLVKVKRLVPYTFQYQASDEEQNIVVMGGFNDWSRTALPLSDADGDRIFERTVYLRPERHEYKFVVDGEELIDRENPVFVSNNIGGWNSILDLSEYQESPAGQFIKTTASQSDLSFRYLPPDEEISFSKVFVLFDNVLLPNSRLHIAESFGVSVDIDGFYDGLLRIAGLDEVGRVIPENHTILKGGQPLNPALHPDDWHFAVLYCLMVDRFFDGDPSNSWHAEDPDIHPLANFIGGDLAGVIKKLEEGYFSNLGVNAIWLSPVGCVPHKAYVESIPPNRKFTGYHGYWPVKPREVDPRFGTEDELKTVVATAHEQGIRVILDFVSNHVHEDHPYFSEHRDWFGSVYLPNGEVNIRNWSEETRLTTWFDSFLPSYDFVNSQAAIDQVVEDALWWLETFALDGFRQDAVKHVPHSFWKQLTSGMKSRIPGKDLYQIGESFGSDDLIKSYVNPGELSSQFNFSIYFNARGPFSDDNADFSHLGKVIRDNLKVFGPVNLMGNITSSHDQVRFIAFADGHMRFDENGTERAFTNPPTPVRDTTSYDKLANFTAFNLSISGVPVIYYGEEIGLMGAGDPDNRRQMRFESQLTKNENQLIGKISTIVRLRQRLPSLSVGDFIPLIIEGSTMIFAKAYYDEFILVAFNHSKELKEIKVNVPYVENELINLLDGTIIPFENGFITLLLMPYSYNFYKPR